MQIAVDFRRIIAVAADVDEMVAAWQIDLEETVDSGLRWNVVNRHVQFWRRVRFDAIYPVDFVEVVSIRLFGGDVFSEIRFGIRAEHDATTAGSRDGETARCVDDATWMDLHGTSVMGKRYG